MHNEFAEYVPVLEPHNADERMFIKSMRDAVGIIYDMRKGVGYRKA
jgi:hypothetical protein